jgi:hypothetical protein
MSALVDLGPLADAWGAPLQAATALEPVLE